MTPFLAQPICLVWLTRELWPVQNARGNLHHVLCGCRTYLALGRSRWWHDQVLRKLTELTESIRVLANKKPQCHQKQIGNFGQSVQNCPTQDRTSVLAPGNDWSMRADLDKQLTDITKTTLTPDIVLWLATEKRVLIVKLTVPCEGGIQEAYERKKLLYAELVAECQEREAGEQQPIQWKLAAVAM